jgi:hypothetical protein
MLAMTTTIFFTMYAALVAIEALALLVVGDLPVFLGVRFITGSLLFFGRYLRYQVASVQQPVDPAKIQFFNDLLWRLFAADTLIYGFISYLMLSWHNLTILFASGTTFLWSALQLYLEGHDAAPLLDLLYHLFSPLWTRPAKNGNLV